MFVNISCFYLFSERIHNFICVCNNGCQNFVFSFSKEKLNSNVWGEYACLFMFTFVWKPEVNTGYLLQSLSTLEMRSLNLKLANSDKTGYPARLGILLSLPSQHQDCKSILLCPVFYMVLKDWIQAFILMWQAHYWLIPRPALWYLFLIFMMFYENK